MSTTPTKDDRRTIEPAFVMPENHLDLVVSPGSVDPGRRASLRTTLITVISMPVFFLVAFTLAFVSSAHAPVPHDMAITLAGPTATTDRLVDLIDEEAPGAFDVTVTTDASRASEDVSPRASVGSIVVDGTDVTTVVASGGGALAVPVVTQLGQQVAAELGGTATLENVAPLPADDPGGSVLFFLLVICTVGAFLSITAVSQVLPAARTRSLVATAAGAALTVPLLGFAVISLFVDFEVPFGSVAAVLGVGAIYAFTVGLLATLFTKLAGQGGVLLVILFLIAVNFPSAGGSVPESMLPPFWQVVHNSWIGSGAFEQMRNILFFGGDGSNRWLVQLLIWTAGSIVLLAAVTAVKKRRARPTPDAAEAEVEVEDRPIAADAGARATPAGS